MGEGQVLEAADGARIHWRVDGEGDGPLVLLSHGYSATGEMFAPQVEALRSTHRVVTWDMRGHGRTEAGSDQALYSEDATTSDIAALLDEIGVGPAVIGGMSLGGYMSLAFQRRFPERCRALVLIDTGPGFKNDEARARWNESAEVTAQGFEKRGLEALPRRHEVGLAQHKSAEGLALAARGMLAQRDDRVIQALPRVSVPTLIVVGENDTPFLAAASYMEKKISGAERVVIPDAGHAANLDQPELVNRALLSFLEKLP